MIRRPPRSTPLYSSAASDVYKRQILHLGIAGARVGAGRRANAVAEQVLTDHQRLHDAVVAEDLLFVAQVVVDLDVVIVTFELRHRRSEVVGLGSAEVLGRVVALDLQGLRALSLIHIS